MVLPESGLGFWTSTVERVWKEGLCGSELAVVVGAAVIDVRGYDNRKLASSADVPRSLIVSACWFRVRCGSRGCDGPGRAVARGPTSSAIQWLRLTVPRSRRSLICYKQLMLWPGLQLILHPPEMIVAVSNG